VTITLTDEGFEHLEEVVDVVFQYIRMLKQVGIQRWVFDEVAKVNQIDFQFMETKGPDALVLHCVGNMLVRRARLATWSTLHSRLTAAVVDRVASQWHPDELAVAAPNSLREFNEELLNELFSYLVPTNLLYERHSPRSLSSLEPKVHLQHHTPIGCSWRASTLRARPTEPSSTMARRIVSRRSRASRSSVGRTMDLRSKAPRSSTCRSPTSFCLTSSDCVRRQM